ncbi:E3 ubiquitin-protein ligase MARCHF2-like [Macrosteles quadrilineatus]|uniref:E3 ubiquitin-protein ligase MARCHF2-like n=1 Tax=Macrosteles quadrilineatus TaxID=74068 RepID=UPI0023E213FB|nr:E3 ubiquitin-protein ligase MARCHF2-like [Macrosteles quadrilineatus]
MSKTENQTQVSNHDRTGSEERTAGASSLFIPDIGNDVNRTHINDYYQPSFSESKNYKTEKLQVQSSSCLTMSTDLQSDSTMGPDNIPEDVMVVRTSAMGPYPMSLLASNSPMNKSISSSASGSICRICLEGDCVEELISPCDCMGSMGVVHICCLEKWLSTSNLDRCEVCKFQFKVQRTPRPIIQWLFSRQSRDGPHGFCGDALCLILLTPICLTSVYLCGMGSLAYLHRGAWEGVGLAFLSLIVLFTFFLWGFTTVRFQWQSMNRWRMSNQTVHLVDYSKVRRKRQCGPTQCNAHRTTPSATSTLPHI